MISLMDKDELARYPLMILPPESEGGKPPCATCEGYRPEPQRSGNLQVDPEIHLPSPGMDVDIAYFYNAAATNSGPFGYGRQLSTNLTAQGNTTGEFPPLTNVILTRANGALASYIDDGLGHFTAQTAGVLNSMTQSGAYFKETTPDGHSAYYPYGVSNLVTTIAFREDAVGNRHTFSYASGLLSTIEDAVGRFVSFSYSGGLLSSIQDWAGRRTTFQYDTVSASPKNLLTTVIGPSGCQTLYGYATFLLAGSTSDWLMNQITDPNGFATSYSYDQQRRVTTRYVAEAGTWSYYYQPGFMLTVDPLGHVTTQSLGTDYALASQQSPTGGIISFSRDANLQPTNQQNALGAVWTTLYDASGNVTGSEDPLGNITTLTRDAFNNITSVETMDGAFVTNIWGYGASPFDTTGAKRRLQATVNQLGLRTSYTFNDRGQMTSVQNALGFISTMGYDSLGNRTTTQDALGNRWTATFDLASNVIAQMNPLGAVWSTTFDPQNRPLTQMDPLGNITTAAYDSVGNLIVQINPLGFRTSATFNVFDKPTGMQNALGAFWTSVYDAVGQPIASLDPLGNRGTNVFDAAGRPVAQINPLGFATSTIYDLAGRVVARQDALGFLSTSIFDIADRPIAMVDALGFRTTTNYNNLNQPVSGQNALGYFTTTVFDVAGRPIATVDALGYRTSTVFDVAGQAVASQDALGFVSTRVFDGTGQPLAAVDALGRLTTTVFDAANRAISIVDALNNRWSTSFDATNRPTASVDPLGRISTTVFDAAGQMTASVSSLGYRTSYALDAIGRSIATQDVKGNVSSTVFDLTNQAIASISPLGYRTTSVFDAASRTIATRDALGFYHSTIFDAVNRPIATMDPLGYLATTVFSALGQALARVDALGNRSSAVFDATGRQVASQNALGNLTTTIFDAVGRTIALVDANSHRTSSLFNGRGDLLSTWTALGAFTSWQYDAIGNANLRTDARNWPTSYTVDALNRTVGQLYIDGTRVTNTFDGAGQQLTQQDLLGIRSFYHDLDGRQTNVAFPTGLILTHTFDSVSNRVSTLDPDNGLTTWSYDAQNRIVGIANPLVEFTTVVWDALDREQHKVLANGMAVSHTFDAAGRETVLENRKADGTGLAVYTNSYDSVGNRLTVVELDGTHCTFGYDFVSQLTLEQRSGPNAYNTSYVYDPLGNRLQKFDNGALTASQYNSANELVLVTPPSGPPSSNTWDENGNLQTQVTGADRTTYTWDPENRLVVVKDISGTTTSAYSADGLRQKKVVGPNTVNFVWDDVNVLQERDANLATTAQYTDWPGFWGGLVSQRRSTISSFYGFDSQHSTRVLVAIGAEITDSYSYKAFGEELAAGSGTVNPHRYVGMFGYFMDAVNRYYVRDRYPDVRAGNWLSVDKVGLQEHNMNQYIYCGLEPLVRVDPSGLAALCMRTRRPCQDRTDRYCRDAEPASRRLWAESCFCFVSGRICNLLRNRLLGNSSSSVACDKWVDCINGCLSDCYTNPSKCSPLARTCWAKRKKAPACSRSVDDPESVADPAACCNQGIQCEQTQFTQCISNCKPYDVPIQIPILGGNCAHLLEQAQMLAGDRNLFPLNGPQQARIAAGQGHCCKGNIRLKDGNSDPYL